MILMFFVQAIAPVIPFALLAGVAGIIFGKMTGFFLAWGSALGGTLFLYLLAKYVRISIFEHIFHNNNRLDYSNMSSKTIFLLLLLIRIFPVIPTPVINIGSGLSGIPVGLFALSSALGMMPWAAAYVTLGDYFKTSHDITNTLTILGIIFIAILGGVLYFRKRIKTHLSPRP